MTRAFISRGWIIAVLLLIIVPRVLAPFVGKMTARSLYRGIEALGIDDELPAAAGPVSLVLFWPWHRDAYWEVWHHALTSEQQPNDLLVYATSRKLAGVVTPTEARALFLNEVGLLRTAGCERKYLVAPLLPLAERAGLSTTTRDVLDAYHVIGRDWHGSAASDCQSYDDALARYASASMSKR